MKNLLSIPVITFIFLGILGCSFGTQSETPKTENTSPTNTAGTPAAQKTEEPAGDKPIRSTELIEAFRKDKAAANAKYKDKVILISGKITNINDVAGVKALNLRDSESEMGLQTYLANNSEVEKVKVGDEVIVRGKVRGDGIDVIDSAVIIKVNPAGANKSEEAANEKPIRSTELIEAFKKDKEAANAKYKDKVILISGKITNINDVFGTKALNLRDNETASGLQTYLANKSDVEKVKVGDEVIVRGKVRGDDSEVIDNAVIIKVN